MKYVFSKPYIFDDKEYKEIEFDLDALTGADYAAVKKDFARGGNFAALPQADSEFCARILERVAKKPLAFFQNLPVKDYCGITQEVSNFLMS